MNCGQGRSGAINAESRDTITKMELLQNVAYQGTYLAAVKQKTRRLFLTLIGGGILLLRPLTN